MANRGDHDRIEAVTSSSSTSSSTRDVLRDLRLSEEEELEVMITQVRHRVPIDLDPPPPPRQKLVKMPQTETSSSSLGANEEGEDGPEASSREASDAFLADSDNEFGADDVASTVILRTLNRNCRDFLIPSGMQMRVRYEEERLSAPLEGWMASYQRFFVVGLCFPLHPLLCRKTDFGTFLLPTSTSRGLPASRGHIIFIRGDIRSLRRSPPRIRAGARGFLVQCDHVEFPFRRVPPRRPRVPVNFRNLEGRPERRQCPALKEAEYFNLKTILAMDLKEYYFKGLLASSTLASVGWHPYLALNPLLRRHGITRLVQPEVDDMIPNMEESLAAIREALIPQLSSSSTASPHGIGCRLPANGGRGIAKIGPRKSLTAIAIGLRSKRSAPGPGTPPSLKRHAGGSLLQQFSSKRAKSGATSTYQGESSRAQGPPLTSRSTEAPHGEENEPLLYRGLPLSLEVAFAEYKLFRARAEDARDKALEEKKKVDEEASTSKETKGQLRKELENLRAEFSDLYFRGFIDCHLEVTARFPEARIDLSFLKEAMGPESYNAMMAAATGAEPSEGESQEGVEDTARGGNGGEA
ncbi:hypothetical protein TorRG33x02_355180 [Trema orientale]|uniref:Uncharacterized protein n=1 Tax=Trema orientale TaxID=63057 RepID=A0A2P5A9N2_TREOI|nr:hypothetical protein TorRG33x02_355180 [Trema orientale]